MMNGKGQGIEDAALHRALRVDLPSADAMAERVRARLAARGTADALQRKDPTPRGVILRFADWSGLRNAAASFIGPVLLPFGLARAGATGTLAAKGILPKSLLAPFALPLAVLTIIGLTLQISLSKTSHLQGETGAENMAEEALRLWWKKHTRAVWALGALLFLVNIASARTATALLALGGLVAHALCTEYLSDAKRASRRATALAAESIGVMVYCMSSVLAGFSGFFAKFVGLPAPHQREMHQGLLHIAVTHLTLGVLTLIALQGRSRFMGPWELLTKGTHLDLGKLAGVLLVAVAAPGSLAALVYYVQEANGSLAEQLWTSRASLAWFAFCFYAVVTSLRAPLVLDDER